jgi:uncharacterized membrane protein YkvA (DUF1232 family)
MPSYRDALNQPGWKQAFFEKMTAKAGMFAFKPARLLGYVTRAARLAKTHRDAFGEDYGHLRALLRMLTAFARGAYKPAAMTVVSAAAVVLYIVSPLDLIPDFLLGLGWLDDAAFFAWALGKLGGELDRFVQWERAGASPRRPVESRIVQQ